MLFRRCCAIWLVCLSWVPAQDSVVVFSEIHYHPPAEETEWIELHNQMAVDVDISGWRLRGGIKYDFPADTVIGGGDYLIIAADPAGVKVPFIDVFGSPIRIDLCQGKTSSIRLHGLIVAETVHHPIARLASQHRP